jgi:hypothetical protein
MFNLVYLQLESIPLVFTKVYGFNTGENGQVFGAQIVGPGGYPLLFGELVLKMRQLSDLVRYNQICPAGKTKLK